jgi:hypothetical protein
MKSSTCKCRLLRKILLWIVGILILLRVAIPVVGVAVANRMLPGILGTDASIGGLDMVLLRGRVSTGGIQIAQPEGFEGGPLLSLGNASVDVSIPSLMKGPITVESVTIDALALELIKNTNGTLNVEMLAGGGDKNAPVSTNVVAESEAPEMASTNTAAAPPAIAVNEVVIRSLAVSYRDFTFDPPLVVQIEDCNVTITNVLFDPAQADGEKLDGDVLLTALLKQPDLHDAFIGLTAKLGVVPLGVPAANAAVRVVGLELKLIATALPTGILTTITATLGGSCVDAYADIAVAVDILDLQARIKTADASMVFAMGGTPDDPQVDKSTALFNLIGRPGALVGGVASDVGSAGVKVVGAAGKTTAALGGGAVKVVGSIGKGLFKTAKGVATADVSAIGEGLKTTTVGTVTTAADAVVDTASTAATGVGDAASAAVGKDDTDAWQAGSEARWLELWAEAKAKVEAAPFPRPEDSEESAPETDVTDEAEMDSETVETAADVEEEEESAPEASPTPEAADATEEGPTT